MILKKFSTHIRKLSDLLREANFDAQADQRNEIKHEDIERAVTEQIFRTSRVREEHYEQIERGTILIDTEDSKVGQVNGLSYVELGDYAFGVPVRITARVSVGKGEVMDIEREVKLKRPDSFKGRINSDRLSKWSFCTG